LWVNGIHHGDISLNNLMYAISANTRDPIGILNDFDLATWVDRSTMNNDRTGTIPFMAIDLLEGGLDRRIPRLYRHDMESFSWVLAYVTVANIEYKDRTIKISPPSGVNAWFKDGDQNNRRAHILLKSYFHSGYGRTQGFLVFDRYYRYFKTVQRITRYWSNLHEARIPKAPPLKPTRGRTRKDSVVSEPEVDDPAGSLRSFIKAVEESLEGAGDKEGFAEVKAHLLEAIETLKPTVKLNVVQPHASRSNAPLA
jgi:hypothetical protein